MPLPDMTQLCVGLSVTPGEMCVTFPVGNDLCVQWPSLIPPDPTELIKQLFAQMNAAMAPLAPIFNIIDAVVAVFDCVKAIATLNPEEILGCIPNLAEKIDKLLKLIPQLSLPLLIVGFLDALITYLEGTKAQLLRQKAFIERVIAAQSAAAMPGNVALSKVVLCALDSIDNFFVFMNEQSAPLNRLIGIVNLFLATIGLGKYCIPNLGSLAPELIDPGILALDGIIQLLEILRSLIPIGKPLPFPQGNPNASTC